MWLMNNSFLNRTMPKDKEKDTHDLHNCIQNGCSGSRFPGLNLTCCRCYQPWFFDCIIDRPEISDLVKVFGFLSNEKKSQNETSKNISKISGMFNSESTFEFVCPGCKKQNGYNDLKMSYENQIGELEKKIKTITSESKKAKKDFETEIKLLKSKIADHDFLLPKQTVNDDGSEVSNTFKALELMVSDFGDVFVKQMNAQCSFLTLLNQYKSDSDAFKSALDKLLAVFRNRIPEPEKSRVPDPHHIRKNDENSTETPNFAAASTKPSLNDNKIVNQPLLRPPKVSKASAVLNKTNKDFYEIYVSKFDTTVKCTDIIQHILNTTDLVNDELFNVVMLIGSNDRLKKKSFISFKITTLKEDVYLKILDETIWAPDYAATPFVHDDLKPTPNTNRFSKTIFNRSDGENSPLQRRPINERQRIKHPYVLKNDNLYQPYYNQHGPNQLNHVDSNYNLVQRSNYRRQQIDPHKVNHWTTEQYYRGTPTPLNFGSDYNNINNQYSNGAVFGHQNFQHQQTFHRPPIPQPLQFQPPLQEPNQNFQHQQTIHRPPFPQPFQFQPPLQQSMSTQLNYQAGSLNQNGKFTSTKQHHP